MIESNIIEWLDFGDSAQNLDVYSEKNYLPFFRFLRILVKNKSFPILINKIFSVVFFVQLWSISLINVPSEKEFLLDILNYLKKITLLYEFITSSLSYKNLFIIIFLIIFFDIFLIIIMFLISRRMKVTYLAIIINLLNIVIYYYLIGPAIFVSLTSIWCDSGNHRYLRLYCFINPTHLSIVILSFITILLYISISFIYSIYCNEIDLIMNSNDNTTRIECNYEIYCLISKIGIFIFAFFFYKIDYEEEENFLKYYMNYIFF